MATMKGSTARQKRIKTGNWRPFRPAGMSDATWRTILLLHRYPSEEMSEEEQSHCLGPMLFGKGAARFGDYGRGWTQEQADALLAQGKTPYAMDAREWRGEIVAAIDYYNGVTFAEAQVNGDAETEANFFAANMPWREGDDVSREAANRYLEAREIAASKVDEIWHTICYGPYGAGPWHVMTEGILNGWKDVFTCDENAAFYATTDYDWRCAAQCDNDGELDVQLMAEICPICPNAAIFGGIDCACDILKEGNPETSRARKLVRYLKRAIGELHKRRKAVVKAAKGQVDLVKFDRWLESRTADFDKFSAMRKSSSPRRESAVASVRRSGPRLATAEDFALVSKWRDGDIGSMTDTELDALLAAVNKVLSADRLGPMFECNLGMLRKLYKEQDRRMRERIDNIDWDKVRASWAKEDEENEER